MEYQESASIKLPFGAKMTVTVKSSTPINRDDYLLLKSPAALEGMGRCLADLGNAIRPPDSKEIELW